MPDAMIPRFFEPSLLPVSSNTWRSSDGKHRVTRSYGQDGLACIEVVTSEGGKLVTRCSTLGAALRAVDAAGRGGSR